MMEHEGAWLTKASVDAVRSGLQYIQVNLTATPEHILDCDCQGMSGTVSAQGHMDSLLLGALPEKVP